MQIQNILGKAKIGFRKFLLRAKSVVKSNQRLAYYSLFVLIFLAGTVGLAFAKDWKSRKIEEASNRDKYEKLINNVAKPAELNWTAAEELKADQPIENKNEPEKEAEEQTSKPDPIPPKPSVPKKTTTKRSPATPTTRTPAQAAIITPTIPVAPPTSKYSQSAYEKTAILNAINVERRASGLQAVSFNNLLNQAAYNKSHDMLTRNYFAHTAPDGKSDLDFIKASGYPYQAVGINLAMGSFKSADDLVQAWMNSPGHRKNILADFGKEIGIGIDGQYFTLIIGRQF